MDKGNWKRGKAEIENIKSTLPFKENLISVFENLIHENADSNNADLEKYIENYQRLKEKNIMSLSELKENKSLNISKWKSEISTLKKEKIIYILKL